MPSDARRYEPRHERSEATASRRLARTRRAIRDDVEGRCAGGNSSPHDRIAACFASVADIRARSTSSRSSITEVPTRLLRDALRDRAESAGSSACLDADRLAASADDEVSAPERESVDRTPPIRACQALLAAMAKTTPPRRTGVVARASVRLGRVADRGGRCTPGRGQRAELAARAPERAARQETMASATSAPSGGGAHASRPGPTGRDADPAGSRLPHASARSARGRKRNSPARTRPSTAVEHSTAALQRAAAPRRPTRSRLPRRPRRTKLRAGPRPTPRICDEQTAPPAARPAPSPVATPAPPPPPTPAPSGLRRRWARPRARRR